MRSTCGGHLLHHRHTTVAIPPSLLDSSILYRRFIFGFRSRERVRTLSPSPPATMTVCVLCRSLYTGTPSLPTNPPAHYRSSTLVGCVLVSSHACFLSSSFVRIRSFVCFIGGCLIWCSLGHFIRATEQMFSPVIVTLHYLTTTCTGTAFRDTCNLQRTSPGQNEQCRHEVYIDWRIFASSSCENTKKDGKETSAS